MQDIVVVVSLDTSPKPTASLLPLILSVDGEKDYKEYTSLKDLEPDHPKDSSAYIAARDMLAQAEIAPGAIQRFAVCGIAAPVGAEENTLPKQMDEIRKVHDNWYYLIPATEEAAVLSTLGLWCANTVISEAELLSGAAESEKLMVAQTNDKDYRLETKQSVICYKPHCVARFTG